VTREPEHVGIRLPVGTTLLASPPPPRSPPWPDRPAPVQDPQPAIDVPGLVPAGPDPGGDGGRVRGVHGRRARPRSSIRPALTGSREPTDPTAGTEGHQRRVAALRAVRPVPGGCSARTLQGRWASEGTPGAHPDRSIPSATSSTRGRPTAGRPRLQRPQSPHRGSSASAGLRCTHRLVCRRRRRASSTRGVRGIHGCVTPGQGGGCRPCVLGCFGRLRSVIYAWAACMTRPGSPSRRYHARCAYMRRTPAPRAD